jgi:AcrR family transcriptional regulator
MVRTSSPRPEAQSTRERILDVALDLFVEHGYEGASLRQIAEIMGFSKAALYYHFASKDDLLLALHLRLHQFGEVAVAQLAASPREPASWAAILVDMVDDMMDQRQLLLFHQRSHAAIEKALTGHHEAHGHEDMEAALNAIFGDSALPVIDRVRLGSAIGAIFEAMSQTAGAMTGVPAAELRQAVREVIYDILVPRRRPRSATPGATGRSTPSASAAGRPA